VPLQFPTCLKDAIMYAKCRIRPICRCIGGCVFSYRQDCHMFSSLSFHLRVGPTRQGYLQPPAADPGWQRSRVPKHSHPPPASVALEPGPARRSTCPHSGTTTPFVLIPPSTHTKRPPGGGAPVSLSGRGTGGDEGLRTEF
jgi:hypothetical protein